MAQRLRKLRDFEIVIVCDNSSSMMTTVDDTQRTRWDELCTIVKIVLDIGVIFDANGVDIYFINGRSFLNVKDPRIVDQAFAAGPSGYTPLVPVLDKIFQSPLSHRGRDKKLLVFVATDGVPTDEDGNENVHELERIMWDTRQAETTYVAFFLCTDDPDCVSYLTKWDQTMKNMDVTDDYYTARDKIRRFHGRNYPFSRGDYVVKALVGAIDPEIDALSEPT
ncbi:unnamed protein product [Rotaria sp. Silwood1]|nr:unnamed protein product [Rotaria sp. Silwood1]CAF3759205.1 unnamed protein product [Rotaria sp. Silwood1]CAF4079269.1 unnamed protein product [Rotaria sp. Silwood1]CAF4853554.1 unnamed protein product [Rotaria sp. Silwood1]CAF4959556.1 unnamed protein product [Rotaria sp. Silwood1]